jgi:hypothetical protein
MVVFKILDGFMRKILISLLLISCSGCMSSAVISTGVVVAPYVAAPATPAIQGVVMWKNGEAHKYYDFDKAVIHKSCLNTLQKMGMQVTSESKTLIKAGKKDQFKILLEEPQKNITRVTVRVNFWGDKEYCTLFFQHLDDQLSVVQFAKK